MAEGTRYLIDTKILLRISREEDRQHKMIGEALSELERLGSVLCYSLQNIAEFWNVCTRTMERNGFGLDAAETNLRVDYIERTMTFLPENEQVYWLWRRLVLAHGVRGVQVHDAHPAATMQAHGVSRILTLNRPDFLRYTAVEAVHPNQVLS